jgi:hypothetical protein
MSIQEGIVQKFNNFLDTCETSFSLIVVEMNEEWVDKLSLFAEDSGTCHLVSDYDVIKYAVVAIENETDKIASYISFSVLEGSLESIPNKKQFVKEYIFINGDVSINSILFEFSCTHVKYLRRGLSVLLRLLVITFAIEEDYTSVLSATNDASGSLLKNKFGFEVKEEDDMDYLGSFFLPEMYLSNGILINAKLVLESQYLTKYRDVYSKLEKCSVLKV